MWSHGSILIKDYAIETSMKRLFEDNVFHEATGNESKELFTLDEKLIGFVFVLKLDDNTWVKFQGDNLYVPLSGAGSVMGEHDQSNSKSEGIPSKVHTDVIISEIRSLVSGLNFEKSVKIKINEAQESTINEIENLVVEAYNIF
ncbi:hypothetical protein V6N11_067907 [Hibiscus sabdariffa]|uniref:Alpha-glucan water dikinase-like N-terminal Ig-like domain-containing protein n=1 Tax=Hibiscus sabdariffa TaxID=183260 RepID=A0ABR2SS57_9ROSI